MRGLLLVLGALALAFVIWIALHDDEGQKADAVTTPEGDAPTLEGNPIEVEDAPDPTTPQPDRSRGATYLEITREDAEKLAVDVEVGVLEGIVIQGWSPFRGGGVVELRHGSVPKPMIQSERPERVAHELEIQSDGTFRLDRALPGTYWVRVLPNGTSPREFSAIFYEGETTKRLVVVLGGATLAGTVYDDNGNPMRRMAVRAQHHGGTKGRWTNVESMTDENGAYELTGLLAGRHGVTVYQADLPYDSQTARYGTKTVGPGEYAPFDFGSPHPVVRWTGVVRNRNGNAAQRGGSLVVTPIGGGEGLHLRFETDGTFDFNVPRGTYRVAVTKSEGRFEIEREYTLEDRTLEEDIVLPGAQVTGRVTNRDGDGRLPASQGVYYTPKGKTHHSRKYVRVADDGTYSIDGLAPGVYVVSGWPWKLYGSDGRVVEFEVLDTDLHIELNLEASTE